MGLSGISLWQLLIVLLIIVALFGTRRLKNLGGDLGQAIKNFRKQLSDDDKTSDSSPSLTKSDQNEKPHKKIE